MFIRTFAKGWNDGKVARKAYANSGGEGECILAARDVDFLMAWIEKEYERGQELGVRGLGGR